MDVSWSLAFFNAIATAQTPAEIGGQFVRLAKAFGFYSVYGGLVPRGSTTRKEIATLTLVQHVPEDWAADLPPTGPLIIVRGLWVDS